MIFYFVKIIFVRSYKYLLLTFFSLLVGAFLFGVVVSLSRSVSSFFVEQGKTLIGGDIVMNASHISGQDEKFFNDLKKEGHTLITEYDVQAVFRNPSGSLTAAANIRAVENTFPLYGKITLENEVPFRIGEHRLYAEKSFLDKLDVSVGDKVLIGNSSFKVAGILLKEPDVVSLGVSFTPKVIVAKEDIETSGIDFSQSRGSYKVLIRQNESSPFTEKGIDTIKIYAKENKLRFDDARDGPNNLVRGLSSVKDFVGIVLAVALFLVTVNIGANLTYVLSRFKKTIALLKIFGATTLQIQSVYLIILGITGFLAGGIGSLIGVTSANIAVVTLSSYIQGSIPPAPAILVSFFGGISGFLLIIVASIPFFNSLKYITPKELLSNSSTPYKKRNVYSYIVYAPLPLVIGILLYSISKNIQLTSYAVLGVASLFLFFMLISHSIITYLYKSREYFSFIFSSIISFLKWRGLETVITSAAIMTAFSGVFIVSAVEQNIIYNIQGTISKSAPALYLVDITTSQLPKVKELAGSTFKEYPIIRGRLLRINNKDMTVSLDREITREFNITYRSQLLDGESILSGVWHGTNKTHNAVSFEKSFAKQVGGVTIGDVVTVFIQGSELQATVTSIHESDKSRGTPYFYMIFSPDVLETFPASYFGTTEGNQTEITTLEKKLGLLFPTIIPIQTGKILETVTSLLTTIILVVKIIGIPSILLGLMLVLVMTSQSLYERKSDVLVLRVFGLKKNTIMLLFSIEAGSLILIATTISYLIAHIIAYVLNVYLFTFTLFSFAILPLYMSLFIVCVTFLFSYYIAYTLVKNPLKKLLAEK